VLVDDDRPALCLFADWLLAAAAAGSPLRVNTIDLRRRRAESTARV
jgi:hypothetical protein